jgi:hypothetical protein
MIRTKRVTFALPALEAVLACFGRYLASKANRQRFASYEPPKPTKIEVSRVFNHYAEL